MSRPHLPVKKTELVQADDFEGHVFKVGTSFGMIFNEDKEPKYNWEGVRRCASRLQASDKLTVILVALDSL